MSIVSVVDVHKFTVVTCSLSEDIRSSLEEDSLLSPVDVESIVVDRHFMVVSVSHPEMMGSLLMVSPLYPSFMLENSEVNPEFMVVTSLLHMVMIPVHMLLVHDQIVFSHSSVMYPFLLVNSNHVKIMSPSLDVPNPFVMMVNSPFVSNSHSVVMIDSSLSVMSP